MSYIPDYRKETEKLNDMDQEFVRGYRAAMEDAMNFFNNLDVYEFKKEEEKVLTDAKECMEDWLEMEETEIVCSLFENEEYFDIELNDSNKSPYENIRR